ncbi:MAG: isoleucine--tRNA ligase [Actinobacteria bacterium]|nr:isoleucine--tRNA ligase [Actinomycetota bacterium]
MRAPGPIQAPGSVRAVHPVEGDLDLPALEERVLAAWREHDVFHQSLERRRGAPEWVFYEGPPTANGRPGIHHVWARCFKDLYPRFQTMRGHYVARKAGWDCHGLPVEVEIEKELGLASKPEIEEFGIEEFNRRCRESVQRYVEDWGALTTRIGMWLDTADAYWTLTNEFIESVWWQLKQIWDQGLLYEDFKVVPYCARCGTALSSHEVGQPGAYRDVTEPSVYVRFPLQGDDLDLLVWTTTPWTLVSNVAAAVSSSIRYVRVRRPGRDVVMAADRVAAVYGETAEIVGDVAAADLVGRTYERPFTFVPLPGPDPEGVRVVEAAFVTVEDGSGVVHLAPAFGEVDREVADREGLPTINPVDLDGAFTDAAPPYAGRFVKDADALIRTDLETTGKLEKVEEYTHSYPHCWRCDRPLIYYAKPSWFIRTTEKRDDLMTQNEAIGWHPAHIKHGRFGNWLENNVDWALSRDRYWGTPLPVWRCSERHDTCVGSVEELTNLTGSDQSGLDLHRPYVDAVTFPCPTCNKPTRRLEPVLDAWFDSGAMPAAQFHHPFASGGEDGEDGEDGEFERRFPADFICEAIDQTRGWFYSLLAVNTLVFGSTPYRNVVCLAHVVDKDGQKMSKSKGNVIDPWEVLASKGADALRWYFFSSGSPWINRRVYEEGIDEAVRKFLLTLWNTYKFFVTYAMLDDWEPGPALGDHVLDRWVVSRLQDTITEVTEALDDFDALRGAQALERFVDDVSNWYVRLSRPRFWQASDPRAHATLHTALVTVAKLLAPFCPFIADEIFGNLGGVESVHLEDWPTADPAAADAGLEAEMALARQLVQLGRAARTDAKVRVRQPLPRALLLAPGHELGPSVLDLVAAELNVKAVEVVGSLAGLIRYTVVPNFRELGPRLGPKMPLLKRVLEQVDGVDVRRALDEEGGYRVEVDGESVSLGPGDVEIRAAEHEEFALAQEGPLAVALDLAVDDDLRLEGLAREVARALNDHRKAVGLQIADRVAVEFAAEGELARALERHGDWIAGEVLAVSWGTGAGEPAVQLDIDGSPLRVNLAKAAGPA